MAVGTTTTGSLADSLPTIIAEARIVREQEGVMPQLVEKRTLPEGEGTIWNEISLAKLTAQDVTENTVLDNPQQIEDSLFTIEPTVIAVETLLTDRVARRISKNVFAKIGSLAQNAIQRKKDEDGLTVLDGFSTSLGGAGTTLTSGIISAAKSQISSNTTEPGNPPYRGVLHGFQIKDIQDEIVAGVGTVDISSGVTARVFMEGFSGTISGVGIFEDGNITIDGSDDAIGGVFAMEAIVLVQGHSPRVETRRRPEIGGGATSLYHYDEYAYGERLDAWGIEILTDATAPTS